ncbi:MAG: hypothetical protein JKY48_17800 [Flavobacteriales bacterium]|nr:hypothetical protein [Flavobacteriales bacterium]
MKYFYFCIIILIAACQSAPLPQQEKKNEINLEIDITSQVSPVNTSIRGISILDSNIIWLSGAKGTILRTSNGGVSWEKLNPPDQDSLDFRDVEAFSENSALITSAGYPSRVYKTIDGGISWSLVHENLDSAAFMNSIAFKNQNEGIILGDQLGGRHLILKTNDQGETWTRIDSNSLPKPLKIENGFAASGSCIAIDGAGNYFIGLGGEAIRVFSSKDGENWQATTTPMNSKSSSFGVYSIAHGNGITIGVGGDYLTPDSSHFGILYDSNEWQLTKGAVNGYRSVIDYSDKGKFWVCGGTNGLDLSLDDGETWKTISVENINTLQFIPNSNSAITATAKGEIFLLSIKTRFKKD